MYDLESYFKVIVIFVFVIGIIAGLLVGNLLVNSKLKTTAIENNCAQYNPTTGDFEWIKIEKK